MNGLYGDKRIECAIAIDAKISSAVPIKGANKIAIELPTFAIGLITATANVYALVCDTAAGTFRRVVANGVYSGGSGYLDFELPSSAGNRIVDVPWATGFGYLKIETSNTATAAYTAYVHVMQ